MIHKETCSGLKVNVFHVSTKLLFSHEQRGENMTKAAHALIEIRTTYHHGQIRLISGKKTDKQTKNKQNQPNKQKINNSVS